MVFGSVHCGLGEGEGFATASLQSTGDLAREPMLVQQAYQGVHRRRIFHPEVDASVGNLMVKTFLKNDKVPQEFKLQLKDKILYHYK